MSFLIFVAQIFAVGIGVILLFAGTKDLNANFAGWFLVVEAFTTALFAMSVWFRKLEQKYKKTTPPGPCAKQDVICVIVDEDTGEWFMGTNYCLNPQPKCPRGDMPSGQGYEICKGTCKQPGHAERMAAIQVADKQRAPLRYATAYVMGHTYSCDTCKKALALVVVKRIIMGCPPAKRS